MSSNQSKPKERSESDWNELSHTLPTSIDPVTDEGEAQACLVVISGDQMGQVFRLTTFHMLIGRGEDSHIRIREPSISRKHAEVYVDEHGRVCVEDLESTNGTFVNGERVQSSTMNVGDRLQVGKNAILKLEMHGEVENEFHEQLYDAGTRDPLTGLFNRRYLDQHLDADVRLALRHQEELAVAIIDVDHFKSVNDTHGHLAGDTVLRDIAASLTARIRGEDILARYGGEEFVLLSRRTGVIGASSLAESLRSKVENTRFSFHGQDINITVSVGVCVMKAGSEPITGEDMLRIADDALYEAKKKGRNCVHMNEVPEKNS